MPFRKLCFGGADAWPVLSPLWPRQLSQAVDDPAVPRVSPTQDPAGLDVWSGFEPHHESPPSVKCKPSARELSATPSAVGVAPAGVSGQRQLRQVLTSLRPTFAFGGQAPGAP